MSSESGVSLLFEIFFVTKISVVLTALTIVPIELFLLIFLCISRFGIKILILDFQFISKS